MSNICSALFIFANTKLTSIESGIRIYKQYENTKIFTYHLIYGQYYYVTHIIQKYSIITIINSLSKPKSAGLVFILRYNIIYQNSPNSCWCISITSDHIDFRLYNKTIKGKYINVFPVFCE